MHKTENLINKIIPNVKRPDGKDREWFNNDEILSELNKEELKIVEERLISMLKTNDDTLIPQTLIKLKSLNSIPTMVEKLELIRDPFNRITWASFINELKNGDIEMEKIAFTEFQKLEFIYEIQGVIFHDLIKFNSSRINNRIKEFIDHKYFLVAHHAKKVLNLNKDSKPHSKSTEPKLWWEFWK
ncbi:MAG: hypothetical protein ABJK28_14540 [Algibacter sp.]